MTKTFTVDRVRRYRAKKLGLLGNGKSLIEIADNNCGLHATSFLSPYLSLLARGISSPFNLLNTAQLTDRKLVRIRAMRGTSFIVPSMRLPMLLGAYKAKPRDIKKHFDHWQVDPDSIAQVKNRVLDSLHDQPKTLKELKSCLPDLAEKRVVGQRAERSTLLGFLLELLQKEGQIFSEKVIAQNMVKNMNRFASIGALYSTAEPAPAEERCLYDLIHWYFETQGPADFDDLSCWAGINKITLRKTLSELNLVEVSVGTNGRNLLLLPETLEEIASFSDELFSTVYLLPYEDSYLKAHKDHGILLSGVPEAAVYERGEARPTICVDGRIVGMWRFVQHTNELRIGVEIFDSAAVDPELLNAAKNQVINFAMAYFPKNIDNFAKGIFTGTEPYA